jgi:hypothetical protein
MILTMGVMFFRVAWLCSAVLESSVISFCVALVVPYVVVLGILELLNYQGVTTGESIVIWYYGISVAISVMSFTAGTVHYLRHVDV